MWRGRLSSLADESDKISDLDNVAHMQRAGVHAHVAVDARDVYAVDDVFNVHLVAETRSRDRSETHRAIGDRVDRSSVAPK